MTKFSHLFDKETPNANDNKNMEEQCLPFIVTSETNISNK